jgi:RNA polymerase sigma factor (sigma-70 family)
LIAESGARGPEPDASDPEPGLGQPGSPSSVPEPSPVEHPTSDDDRVNELALAYRLGRSELLSELFAAVRPLLMHAIGRYGAEPSILPNVLEIPDLVQESWLLLDEMARRWDPDIGDFGAYVRTTFPWELRRYVVGQAPGRRAREVRVDQVPHDDLLNLVGERTGIDGRTWDDQLVMAEILEPLDPLARRLVLSHLIDQRPLTEIAQALQLSLPSTYNQYRRALDQLRIRLGADAEPGSGADGWDEKRAMRRLVEALHEGANRGRQLPGRRWACVRTGLSQLRFNHLIGVLVQAGCIEGRTGRRPGRLVYATPEETLACLDPREWEAP